jgi:hypothetical protein
MERTMQKPTLRDLTTVTEEEARAYLEVACGDEIAAALAIAVDRNELAGAPAAPDDAETHHALFLLRRALGLAAPSFDSTRVLLKARAA